MGNDLIIKKQKSICHKYGSDFIACELNHKIGLALDTINEEPLRGLRYRIRKGTAGWYIWGGDYSFADDFLQPVLVREIMGSVSLIFRRIEG